MERGRGKLHMKSQSFFYTFNPKFYYFPHKIIFTLSIGKKCRSAQTSLISEVGKIIKVEVIITYLACGSRFHHFPPINRCVYVFIFLILAWRKLIFVIHEFKFATEFEISTPPLIVFKLYFYWIFLFYHRCRKPGDHVVR